MLNNNINYGWVGWDALPVYWYDWLSVIHVITEAFFRCKGSYNKSMSQINKEQR